MIRICCHPKHKGKRKFGEKPPLEDKRKTHGYCPECFKIEMKELKRIKKEIAKNRISKPNLV